MPDGQALEHALEVAEIVAGNGPLAVEAVLKTLHDTPGMTEAEAADHGGRVAELPLGEMDRAITDDQTDGFIKLIAAAIDAKTQTIWGGLLSPTHRGCSGTCPKHAILAA